MGSGLQTAFKKMKVNKMGIFDFFKPDVEKMKVKRSVKGLIKVLQYDEDENVRKAVKEALEKIKKK